MSFSATPFSRHFSGLPIIRAAVLAAMIAPVFLVTSRLAVAINFDVVYDSGKSNAPATDASGTDLTAIVEAAAAHWADLIEDDWEMKINIWYDTPAAVGGNTAIAPIVNDNTDGTRTGSMLDFSDGQLTAEALFLNAGSTVNWTGGQRCWHYRTRRVGWPHGGLRQLHAIERWNTGNRTTARSAVWRHRPQCPSLRQWDC